MTSQLMDKNLNLFLDLYFYHDKKNTMDIFHDWQPREIAAMKRATAWLRAMQPPEPEEPRESTETRRKLGGDTETGGENRTREDAPACQHEPPG